MDVQVVASGSKENCYVFNDGKATILLECGLSFQRTLEQLNFKLPDAVLITHEHVDHSKSVKGFLKRGVDVYMTAGTARSLNVNRHNLHIVKPFEEFYVHDHKFFAVTVKHDAAEPVCYVIDDEILFATDLGEPPDVGGHFKQVWIEANYDLETLKRALIPPHDKARILENHLSIVQCKQFLRTIEADEIHLIHVSTRHGMRKKFREAVERALGSDEVYVH